MRRAVRTIGTATIACALLASLCSVGALAALTVTWTTAADFEGGTLYGLDASSSPGQLRLATVAPSPWVKHPLNPILGPGSGWEADWVDSPSVLYEGGVYKMWYQGCIGARCDIGYATSPDGLNWTRSPSNPVLLANTSGWDQTLGNPTVVHDGTGYHMWYAGNGPLAIQIGYATSPDGVVWTKVGSGPNFVGHQSWDSGATSTPFVLKVGATFVLYFSGHPGNFAYSIGRATSSDGVNWTEDLANPLMAPQGGWEESRIHPTWVAPAGSGFEIYYTGGYNAPQVGRAASVDGWNWTRDDANPVLALGTPGTWDQAGVAVAKVVTIGATTRLYYGGESWPGNWRIGVADYSPGTSSTRYRPTGYFLSQVVDSGFRNTTWNSIDWSGSFSGATGIAVSIRVGNTPVPDPSWSNGPVLTAPGSSILQLSGRFAQVGAGLVTQNDSVTPVLDQITVTYSPPGTGSQSVSDLGILGWIVLAIVVPLAVGLILILLLVTRRRPAGVPTPPQAFLRCLACGATNPTYNRFCTNCGQPIGGPPR